MHISIILMSEDASEMDRVVWNAAISSRVVC